jgi:hypothetical protein
MPAATLRTLALATLATTVTTAAVASPRGLEFSADKSEGDSGVVVRFSVKGARNGVCYALVNPMGKTGAAACRGEAGWNLHGGKGWTFRGDGELSVRFEGDPGISRIYPEEAGRVKVEEGGGTWAGVNPEEAGLMARKACEGKVSIPEDAEFLVTVTPAGNAVLFLGRGEGGEAFFRAMVMIDRESGRVAYVAAP